MASTNKFELDAVVRHDMGKGASRRLRRDKKVPGVIYGGGKDPVSLTFEHNKCIKALENEAFYSHILTLKISDAPERVILKDVQRHPFKAHILHMDFQRVRADEKLHMHVPLHFRNGELAPGVKDSGGLISHIMSDVEVSCLPDNLPEYLEIDLADMQLNQIKHLSDIPLPKGVEIVSLLHDNDKPIASLHLPRIEEEPVADAAEENTAPSEVPAMAQKSEAEIAADAAAAAKDKDKKEEVSHIHGEPALSSPIQLIVGLANPGKEYADTRHNAGAWFVEQTADATRATLRPESKFHGHYCRTTIDEHACHLLIPSTFMNLSGRAVRACLQYLKLEPNQLLVVHDEIDLPPGTTKLKFDGGDGGHNGLKDIIANLGTKQFYRLRIGVGHPGTGRDVADYVLSKPSKSERLQIDQTLELAQTTLPLILQGHIQKAMQQLHTETP